MKAETKHNIYHGGFFLIDVYVWFLSVGKVFSHWGENWLYVVIWAAFGLLSWEMARYHWREL